MILPPKVSHPEGEDKIAVSQEETGALNSETFYLKMGHLFEPWVNECPLNYVSHNSPKKVNILGSFLLSILSSHSRYAHMTSLMSDNVTAKLLSMTKVVSDDCTRRALQRLDEAAGINWLQSHQYYCHSPLLNQPWILDVDVTVKPLYGKQEDVVITGSYSTNTLACFYPRRLWLGK